MISEVSFIKVIGLGIAISVMLDSIIVRMMMVPSFLILMGDWNWYCPEYLLIAINWLNLDEPPDTLGKEEFCVGEKDAKNNADYELGGPVPNQR